MRYTGIMRISTSLLSCLLLACSLLAGSMLAGSPAAAQQKSTRQVIPVRNQQSVTVQIPMGGMLYLLPEQKYLIEKAGNDRNLHIEYEAADGIVISHNGSDAAKAQFKIRLADQRSFTINVQAKRLPVTANYVVLR